MPSVRLPASRRDEKVPVIDIFRAAGKKEEVTGNPGIGVRSGHRFQVSKKRLKRQSTPAKKYLPGRIFRPAVIKQDLPKETGPRENGRGRRKVKAVDGDRSRQAGSVIQIPR